MYLSYSSLQTYPLILSTVRKQKYELNAHGRILQRKLNRLQEILYYPRG